jgi:hypothetical protein
MHAPDAFAKCDQHLHSRRAASPAINYTRDAWPSPPPIFVPRRSLRVNAGAGVAYSSVYLSDRPRAFSTGYFFAFAAIFASITAATSMPVMFANSRA